MSLTLEIGPRFPGDSLGRTVPGTLDHFLIERYLLYVERLGQLLRGQVHHSPYALRSARTTGLQESLLAANGIEVDRPPCHAAFSERVDVEIFPLVPVRTATW
jgi:hypothetical protein